MIFIRIFFSFLFLISVINIFAKEKIIPNHNFGLDASYQIGKVFKHTKNFQPTITGATNVFQISAFKQTNGKKDWQRKLKYPELGGGLIALLHQNKDTIGNGYAAFAYFTYPFVRSRIVDFILRFSGGVAYDSNIYDEQNNPVNNAMSSPINIFVEARLGLNFKIYKNVELLTGIAFAHYSSGGTRLPNLGLNTPTFLLGLRYIGFSKKSMPYNTELVEKPKYKNEMGFLLNNGWSDITKFDKDKCHIITSGSVQYARYINIVNKLYCGALLEFDFGQPHLHENRALVQNKLIKKAASRMSIYVGNEIAFGRTSIFYALGAYLYTPYKMFTPIYFKIGTNINFLALGKKNRPYFNFGVKAHAGIASYTEIGLGSNFKY